MNRDNLVAGVGQFILITLATALCLVIELITDEEDEYF